MTGLQQPGSRLYFRADPTLWATIKPDGRLRLNDFEGSIHQAGKHLAGGCPCNDGQLRPIDDLRRLLAE